MSLTIQDIQETFNLMMEQSQRKKPPHPIINLNGITVKQLKEWLDQWEKSDEEPTVWIFAGTVSNQVIGVSGSYAGDIFLEGDITMQIMYKGAESFMPSSPEDEARLFREGFTTFLPLDPNVLPDDLPLRELFGNLTLPQVKALVKKLNAKNLEKIKDFLK